MSFTNNMQKIYILHVLNQCESQMYINKKYILPYTHALCPNIPVGYIHLYMTQIIIETKHGVFQK